MNLSQLHDKTSVIDRTTTFTLVIALLVAVMMLIATGILRYSVPWLWLRYYTANALSLIVAAGGLLLALVAWPGQHRPLALFVTSLILMTLALLQLLHNISRTAAELDDRVAARLQSESAEAYVPTHLYFWQLFLATFGSKAARAWFKAGQPDPPSQPDQ